MKRQFFKVKKKGLCSREVRTHNHCDVQMFNMNEHKQTSALLKNITDPFLLCEIIAKGHKCVCVCVWLQTARIFSSTG